MNATDNLPALPPISQVIAKYPNWLELFGTIEGLNGVDLVNRGALGKAVMDAVNILDSQIKVYAKRLPELWAESLLGRLEKNGKEATAIRLAEEKRIADFRTRVKRLNQEVDRERRELVAIETARRQEALREEAEAERRRYPMELGAEPVITPTVSEKQVAKEIFDTPGITVKVIYKRKVTDWSAFLRWLVDSHLSYHFINDQSDGSYRISFTELKRSNMEIPGVECSEDTEFTNRMG